MRKVPKKWRRRDPEIGTGFPEKQIRCVLFRASFLPSWMKVLKNFRISRKIKQDFLFPPLAIFAVSCKMRGVNGEVFFTRYF